MPVLEITPAGLYCPAGDFHIDPRRGVRRAVITHGHGDHARRGSERYLCHRHSKAILHARLGGKLDIETLEHGESLTLGGARVSLHPAGHVLGSAQVRVEVGGEVWVVSGDYKLHSDATCASFEPVRCHGFVTESTFALPIYQWRPPEEVFAEINAWWRFNQERGLASVLSAYSLGKAQRILAGVDASIGPLGVAATVDAMLPAYAAARVPLPPTLLLSDETAPALRGRGLVIAAQGAGGGLKALAPYAIGSASGWHRVSGARRWGGAGRRFVLSDHADWPGLLQAIAATEAVSVGVTHGFAEPLARFLKEQRGLDAWTLDAQRGEERRGAEIAPRRGSSSAVEPSA